MVWGTKTRQQRGYDAAWEKVRKVVIARDQGLCQMCLEEGRVTMGRDVDHKVSKAEAARRGWTRAQTDHPDQLWLLCVPCHKSKTEQEQGKTKHAPRPRIGLDGYPIEEEKNSQR